MAEIAAQIADFHVRLGRIEKLVEGQKQILPDSKLERGAELNSLSGALRLFGLVGRAVPGCR